MHIRTNITRWDLARLQTQMFLRLKSIISSLALWAIGISIYLLWTKGVPTTPRNWGVLLLAAFSGSVGAQVITWIFAVLRAAMISSTAGGILGDHEFEMREAGLFEKTSANETLTKWAAIHSIQRSRKMIYIKIAPGLFHLIPRKAFHDQSQFDGFWNELKRLTGHDA